MSAKQTFLIRKGVKTLQLATGKTLTFSWEPEANAVLTIHKAGNDEPVRRSQQKLARMWAADMAKSGKGSLDHADECYGWFKAKFLAQFIIQHDEALAKRWSEIVAAKSQFSASTFAYICDEHLSTSMFDCAEVSEGLRQWQAFMNQHEINYRDPVDHKAALQLEWHQNGGIK